MSHSRSQLSLFLLLSFASHSIAQSTGSASIFEIPALTEIRPCATSQLDDALRTIDCPSRPLINSCICRSDLAPIVRSYFTRWVPHFCNDDAVVDVSSMVGVYNNYCSTALADTQQSGNSQPVSNSADPTDGAGLAPTAAGTVTTDMESTLTRFTRTVTTDTESSVTQVVYQTITTILDDEGVEKLVNEYNSKKGGLAPGYQVAIGVGVAALAIIILLLFMNKIRRRFFGYKGPYQTPGISEDQTGGIQSHAGEPKY